MRSSLIQSGMKIVTGWPSARPMRGERDAGVAARRLDDEVAGLELPARRRSARMCSAIRSLMLPVMFRCSALA